MHTPQINIPSPRGIRLWKTRGPRKEPMEWYGGRATEQEGRPHRVGAVTYSRESRSCYLYSAY